MGWAESLGFCFLCTQVFDPVFANQLPSKVDPEVRGLSLESVIDLISTDLSLNSESTKAGYTTLVKIINK